MSFLTFIYEWSYRRRPILHWDRDTLQHIPILHSQYISWSLLHCVTPHSLALLYETNSYWLIPSRRETGDLLWVGCLFLQLVFLVDDDDKSAHPPDSARPRPARPTRGGYPRHLWPSMAFEGFLGLKTCFLCQLKTKLLQNKTKQTFFFDRERERGPFLTSSFLFFRRKIRSKEIFHFWS